MLEPTDAMLQHTSRTRAASRFCIPTSYEVGMNGRPLRFGL